MKVLVGVDLRAEAADVVTRVAPWLARLGGVADLLYADTWRSSLEEHLPFANRGELEQMIAEDEAALAKLAESIPEAHRGQTLVVPGLPGEVMAERAHDYDLVAVSTHGRTGLAHLWLGSVAERVVRQCHKSVLVVRTPPPAGPERVLAAVPLDLEGKANAAPLVALSKMLGPDTKIDLLYVDEAYGRDMPTSLPHLVGPRAADIILAEAGRRRSLAEATLAHLRDDNLPFTQRGEVFVDIGPPAQAIIDHAERYDLIAVGTHGRTGLARTMLGSVAERVVQRCPKTLLVQRT